LPVPAFIARLLKTEIAGRDGDALVPNRCAAVI
jgi:hypothetical protein